MIAGDVFDKSVPTNQAIQLFDEFLTSWAELHLPVLLSAVIMIVPNV